MQHVSPRPYSNIYKELQLCNRENEWDSIEEVVICHKNQCENAETMAEMWETCKRFCHKNVQDRFRLSPKRFYYLLI